MRTSAVSGRCAVCGEDDARIVKQYHHVFGRANSTDTIILCHNCHDRVTKDQNRLSPKVRRRGATRPDKGRLMLVSLGSLLELIGRSIKRMGLDAYGNCDKDV